MREDCHNSIKDETMMLEKEDKKEEEEEEEEEVFLNLFLSFTRRSSGSSDLCDQ